MFYILLSVQHGVCKVLLMPNASVSVSVTSRCNDARIFSSFAGSGRERHGIRVGLVDVFIAMQRFMEAGFHATVKAGIGYVAY